MNPAVHTVDELRAKVKAAGPWFPVPAHTEESECRSCGAGIYWIVTDAKKRMPVDCYVAGGITPAADMNREGKGVAHFATCPQGKAWSRR